jgi:hypothetical protein
MHLPTDASFTYRLTTLMWYQCSVAPVTMTI